MIAVDTSSMIAFFKGNESQDTFYVEKFIKERQLCFPPVVLSELLSDPKLNIKVRKILLNIPLLEIEATYWQRVGLLRSKLIAKKRKAKLADTMIVQTCLDHDVPLITRDQDFVIFSKLTPLKLVNYKLHS